MFSFLQPTQRDSVDSLRHEYARLPKLEACDRSTRVELLERLVEALTEENNLMRRREGRAPSSDALYHVRQPPRRTPFPIAVAVKGSLFQHPDTIQASVNAKLAAAQWVPTEYPRADTTAKVRVLFFRVGQRVSPSELEDVQNWCQGQENFVMFLHNEMREKKCDEVGVEAYVNQRLQAFPNRTECASMSFKEGILYPTSSGLNASSVDALVSFLTANAPNE